jgi:hypothetical protein
VIEAKLQSYFKLIINTHAFHFFAPRIACFLFAPLRGEHGALGDAMA